MSAGKRVEKVVVARTPKGVRATATITDGEGYTGRWFVDGFSNNIEETTTAALRGANRVLSAARGTVAP